MFDVCMGAGSAAGDMDLGSWVVWTVGAARAGDAKTFSCGSNGARPLIPSRPWIQSQVNVHVAPNLYNEKNLCCCYCFLARHNAWAACMQGRRTIADETVVCVVCPPELGVHGVCVCVPREERQGVWPGARWEDDMRGRVVVSCGIPGPGLAGLAASCAWWVLAVA